MKQYRIVLAFFLIISLVSPVYAGWKDKITRNQIKAINYISKLKAGADPEKTPRPKIRRDEKARSAAATREVREAIDRAEHYARQGNYKRIEIPQFKHIVVSDKRFKELQREMK